MHKAFVYATIKSSRCVSFNIREIEKKKNEIDSMNALWKKQCTALFSSSWKWIKEEETKAMSLKIINRNWANIANMKSPRLSATVHSSAWIYILYTYEMKNIDLFASTLMFSLNIFIPLQCQIAARTKTRN